MTNAIFYHKHDSIYDDDPATRYHFPKQYLSRVEQTLKDWIIYYGPIKGMPSRYYTATALVKDILKDNKTENHYYASIQSGTYLDFDHPLEYSKDGGYEKKLFKLDGKPNGGRTVQAVRILEKNEFVAIINAGLSEPEEWPPRKDNDVIQPNVLGFSEDHQARYLGSETEREIVSQLVNRPFRDVKFRKHIRTLYDRTCAFTGLRLINGKGRPEVEACHIIPVEDGGNDSVQNGIALSGTVHWMFDRGLLSLSDDYDILASRQLNHDVSHLLYTDRKARVPKNKMYRPHPRYLDWHRRNKFKG